MVLAEVLLLPSGLHVTRQSLLWRLPGVCVVKVGYLREYWSRDVRMQLGVIEG